MARGKTVLVPGGGIGGIVAAAGLRQMLPREHRVVPVERESRHVFSPSFLWMMVGQRSLPQIKRRMQGRNMLILAVGAEWRADAAGAASPLGSLLRLYP